MNHAITKSPRLYIDTPLQKGETIPLPDGHAHYLLTVMRKGDGDVIRVFNGKDGEFSGVLHPLNKKSAELTLSKRLIKQPKWNPQRIHLYFAPIKKDRLAFLIEKAVELGVTDLHPVMTEHTENRKPNMDKVEKYIIEAAEQCERMDIPTLHPMASLTECQFIDHCFAAIERIDDLPTLMPFQATCGLLIGPEGGWSDNERDYLLAHQCIHPVSLGDLILRAETAGIYMLSKIR